MTRKINIAVLMLLGVLAARGQALDFVHKTWDFGSIREVAGPVKHTFAFTNPGPGAVVVEHVEVSCGCTTTDFSRKPVMAGNKGQITVTFDPSNRPGPFTKTVVVTANNRSLQATLSLSGTVVERQRSVQELYPFDLGSGLRVDVRSAYFRNVEQGGATSLVVKAVNTSPRAVALAAAVDPAIPFLRMDVPETLCAGCRHDLTFTFDLTAQRNAYGVFSGNIWFTVNGKRAPTSISTVAYGVDPFPAELDDAAPRARFSEVYHDFGDVAVGQRPVQELTLTNPGGKELVIRAVAPGKGVATSLRAGMAIPAGGTLRFTLGVDAQQMAPGAFNGSVMLILNDPLRPVREVRAAAYRK